MALRRPRTSGSRPDAEIHAPVVYDQTRRCLTNGECDATRGGRPAKPTCWRQDMIDAVVSAGAFDRDHCRDADWALFANLGSS
jgi:hypothetical protein